MCGIIAGVAQRDVAPILLEGLKRLEYRGYDSAGIAVIAPPQALSRVRVCGKVQQLSDALKKKPLMGHVGVAHTRWATHGKPCQTNAHPHVSGDAIALVHNGIIENYVCLRQALEEQGCVFDSDTDSEVIVHLVARSLKTQPNLVKAVQAVVGQLQGTYAFAVITKDRAEHIVAVKKGSPLVIGIGIGEVFVASDSLALLPVAQQIVPLEDGDVVEIFRQSYTIYDVHAQVAERRVKQLTLTEESADKGKFRHFMQKEIFEQPQAICAAMEGRFTDGGISAQIFGAQAKDVFEQTRAIQLVGCGTSFHAGMVARFWLQELLGIPCQVEVASEYRHQRSVVAPGSLYVTLSQSGETADTLLALRHAKTQNYCGYLGICNVPDSALIHQTQQVFLTHAGPEIGVASTKAFTTQLVALLMLLGCLGGRVVDNKLTQEIVRALRVLPSLVKQILQLNTQIAVLAKHFADRKHALFIGRGIYYPVLKEGALKLTEVSYIHAEAYPAGELKHGPLALIDPELPVLAIVAQDTLQDKMKSNIEEVRARGGQVFVLADAHVTLPNILPDHIIRLPAEIPSVVKPILFSIPLQLLAYHVAILKGTDVDQPRNLAKSVTVE